MNFLKRLLIIMALIVLSSAVITAIGGLTYVRFINVLFLTSLALLVIGGFRYIYERGAFDNTVNSFKKAADYLGIETKSARSRYVEHVEQSVSQDNPSASTEQSAADRQYDPRKEWGFASALFFGALICMILSFILTQFYY